MPKCKFIHSSALPPRPEVCRAGGLPRRGHYQGRVFPQNQVKHKLAIATRFFYRVLEKHAPVTSFLTTLAKTYHWLFSRMPNGKHEKCYNNTCSHFLLLGPLRLLTQQLISTTKIPIPSLCFGYWAMPEITAFPSRLLWTIFKRPKWWLCPHISSRPSALRALCSRLRTLAQPRSSYN